MDDITGELVWRVRALALAKRMRASDVAVSKHDLAAAIWRRVDGAPRSLATIEERLRVWERTGAIPCRRRAEA